MTVSVIIGASAGLGSALAEALAQRGDQLVLAASDPRDLDAIAADLRLRFGASVAALSCDLETASAAELRDRILAAAGGSVDGLYLVAGAADDDDDGSPLPPARLARLATVNFTAPLALANAMLADLAARPQTVLVGIGSVASIRGRSRNSVYGAAKRGLEFYFEALAHRFAGSGPRVLFYRAGYMDTTMLAGRAPALLTASPRTVARRIVADTATRSGCHYLPGWWRLVALVLTMLPFAVFRRLRL